MSSEPDPWSLSGLLRKRFPKTSRRVDSRKRAGDLNLQDQLASGLSQSLPSASTSTTSLPVPSSAGIHASNAPGPTPWQALTQALQTLESSLEVFPPLKNAIGGLVSCIQHVKMAQRNQAEYERLASDLTGLADSLQSHVPASRPTRMPYSIPNVARAIEEHTAYLQRKHEQHAVIGFVVSREDHEEMDISLSTWTLAHEQWVDTRLKDLLPAYNAYYNSTLSMEMQRCGCTENTRMDVLDNVRGWTRNPDAEKVYWMNGMAGTGKTTIAYSLCERLEEDNQLAASFFCSRNSPECRDVSRIVPTIAYQLGRYSNPYQSALCEVLGNNTDVARRKVDVQFKKLIAEPLVKVKDTLPKDMVVVIDALDECADSNGMRLVLDLLFQHVTKLPVKFFIASRPEPMIYRKITRHDPSSRAILHLHDIEKSLVQADILLYLAQALAPINPLVEDIERLAARAGCLFIFAATVVRYIAPETPSLNHSKRLATMLQASSSVQQGSYKDIDDLYSTILANALEDILLEDSEKELRRRLLWTIICAREPLNATTLVEIFDIEEQQELESALEPLRSVLHVTGANGVISTLHASFPDFLLSDRRSGRFVCDKATHDQYLASQCFNIMGRQLRFNICKLESSYLLDSEVPDIVNRVNQSISLGLAYACRYWGDHLICAKAKVETMDLLEGFLKNRFLFWMEALNLKGWMGHAENTLTQVLIWLPKSDHSAELRQFVYDARNFVTAYTANAVSHSTPHIYMSALPFTSKESRVWLHYSSLARGLIRVEGAAMAARERVALASWPAGSDVVNMALSTDGRKIASGLFDNTIAIWDVSKGARIIELLCGHKDVVTSITFSPDNTHIASGSLDKTIIIWSSDTGVMIAGPLHGHTDLIPSLAFSPDGSRLVSASEDHTMRAWDGRNGTGLGKSFEGHKDKVMSVMFSPDGKRIASGSDDRTIRVWDPETCVTIAGPFVGHTDWIDCIAFSPDGQRIVSSSRDRTIRIWDSHNGDVVAGPFEGHTDRVRSVAFSPDGMRVVSGSYDRTVCVWDSHDGRLLAGPFDGHRGDVNAVLFSTDGTRVYSGSADSTICVWDARDGAAGGERASGHIGVIQCAAFSSDGTRATSGSADCTVCVWDTHSGALIAGPLTGHADNVLSISFSPDGARIVSGSKDCTLRTWDASTGSLLAGPFRGHTGGVWSVTFSLDGSRIASGSSDATIRLWDSRTGASAAKPFQGHTGTIACVAISHDGTRIVSGSIDRTVRMWDATDGSLTWASDAHTSPVLWAAFSPDEMSVVSGSGDSTVLIIEARAGVVLHGPFVGPTSEVWLVTLSPDGETAAAISRDRMLHVWEPQSERVLAGPLREYGGGVWSVTFSPDGTRIIVGWANGLVRVWDVASIIQPTASSFHDWSINGDGWLIDSNSQRIVWVPSDLRRRVSLPGATKQVVMGGSCAVRIDDTSLLGDRWGECYDVSRGPAS